MRTNLESCKVQFVHALYGALCFTGRTVSTDYTLYDGTPNGTLVLQYCKAK
jgi:NADH:ubiquinone oxidoreductase subunit E